MTSRATTPQHTGSIRVGLRCEATPSTGVGHVVRSLALGDEIRARGGTVVLLGAVEVPWLAAVVRERGIDVVAAPADPEALAALAADHDLDAVVLDGYALDPGCGAALRARGIRVLSLVDADFGRGQDADVYLDHNFAATGPLGDSPDAVHLAGLSYALFRDEVLAHRMPAGHQHDESEPPRVLMLFGGTDPYGAAPVLLPLVLATGAPVHVVIVAANADIAAALAAVPTGPGQSVEVLANVPDIGALAATCDAAVTAAGSSVWEFLCLAVPAAVVCVVDNQESGYVATTTAGVVEAAGRLEALRHDESARARSVEVLHRLLTDAGHREHLRTQGVELVDGRGRERVVDALLG